jgi:hypothetical protein
MVQLLSKIQAAINADARSFTQQGHQGAAKT